MLPETVIDREIPGQPYIPLDGVLERHGVEPFLAEGLDIDEVGRRPYRLANLKRGSINVCSGSNGC